jgi:hypothetical protein
MRFTAASDAKNGEAVQDVVEDWLPFTGANRGEKTLTEGLEAATCSGQLRCWTFVLSNGFRGARPLDTYNQSKAATRVLPLRVVRERIFSRLLTLAARHPELGFWQNST